MYICMHTRELLGDGIDGSPASLVEQLVADCNRSRSTMSSSGCKKSIAMPVKM